jgi:hypothetical protein
MTIEARIGQLEKCNRNMKKFCVLCLLVIFSACCIAADKITELKSIYANELLIVHDDHILAELSGNGGRKGTLELQSADTKNGVGIIVTDDGGGIVIKGKGKPGVVIGINSDGDGFLNLYDSNGHVRSVVDKRDRSN